MTDIYITTIDPTGGGVGDRGPGVPSILSQSLSRKEIIYIIYILYYNDKKNNMIGICRADRLADPSPSFVDVIDNIYIRGKYILEVMYSVYTTRYFGRL